MLEEKMDLIGDSLVSNGHINGYKVVRVTMPYEWDLFHCGEEDNETIVVERDETKMYEVVFCGIDKTKTFSEIFDHVLANINHNKTKIEKNDLFNSYLNKLNEISSSYIRKLEEIFMTNDLENLKKLDILNKLESVLLNNIDNDIVLLEDDSNIVTKNKKPKKEKTI